MPVAIFLLPLLAPAAQAPLPSSAPITVTGHAWAPFISPMGEPFRAHSRSDDTLADWFNLADRNHDGVLTSDEMVADAERFFEKLDTKHDGQIDPDELAKYEWEVAPEIQVNSKTRRAPGQGAPATKASDLEETSPGKHRHGRANEQDSSLGIGGALQGAARYGLLNIPEPVASADTDFDRSISLEEFKQAAIARFQLLDSSHQGRLTLSQLEALRSLQLIDQSKRRKAGDAGLGNPLPPGP